MKDMINSKLLDMRILNVGEGDLEIKFDKDNPKDRKRAAEIIKDLLSKGYAIMVKVGENVKGPLFQRVHGFDPTTSEYIVMGDVAETDTPISGTFDVNEGSSVPPVLPDKKRPKTTHRVPSSTPTVAVARSAGGYDPNVISSIRPGVKLQDLGRRL